MPKKQLSSGVRLKVENRSGFDKSFFNALTTGVGTITPIVKQLVLPNSSGKCSVKISAQLPPLATDAFLRSHLKLEAFLCPLRLCYGGFESWFCGREVYNAGSNQFVRAELPRLGVINPDTTNPFKISTLGWSMFNDRFGAGSLLDYFGAYWKQGKPFHSNSSATIQAKDNNDQLVSAPVPTLNIFPWIAYGLIYDEYYRNKLVERPLFTPPASASTLNHKINQSDLEAWAIPSFAYKNPLTVLGASGLYDLGTNSDVIGDNLLNGRLTDLRQRNYGDDYFTAATPSPQEGSAVSVSTSGNQFTIGALRLANSLQEFAEVSNYASPDYIQTLSARYGASLKAGIAQKPILLGSADFPMYTSGVEQTAQGSGQTVNNPFDTVGARYGRAHAEGTDFVCDFNCDEPAYLMVMATLVPEAQYFQGIARDLLILNDSGSLTDLPCAQFENIGNDVVHHLEVTSAGTPNNAFGYVQRFLWHKLGNRNQTHGLFRMDESLGSFVVQRDVANATQINSAFLKVAKTDLDNIAAVSSGVSGFGVLIDSAIKLYISEPLGESSIPSLANPAYEHGRSVYVRTGGTKLA